jgi:nucleoside-diphosphate-sugar epimerase
MPDSNLATRSIKILVNGANGFIGTNLIKCLMGDPLISVRAMVQANTPLAVLEEFQAQYGKNRLEIVFGDLLQIESLEAACVGMDVVVHLAGLVTDWAPRALFFKVIVGGTENMIAAARKAWVKRFIHMSSLTVHSFSGHRYDDESAPRDMTRFPYGEAKAEAEKAVEACGLEYAIIRPAFTIYGIYDIGSFINALDAIITGKYAHLNGGKSLISYVYSENLAHGIYRLITAQKVHGPYLIVDGNMSWRDFVDAWTTKAGVKPIRTSVPYWVAAPIAWIMESVGKLFRMKKSPLLNMYRISIPKDDLAYSPAKIETELGYSPLVGFDESLNRTLDYYHQSKKK